MYRTISAVAAGFPKRLVLLAMLVVAVAVPLAQANAARQSGRVHLCRTGNAPLAGGASTNAAAGAGLVARGWDSQSAGATRNCKS
jgi:hypothetical protein